MSASTENGARLIVNRHKTPSRRLPSQDLTLHCLEWPADPHDDPREITVPSVADLISREKTAACRLKIVLAPLPPAFAAEDDEFKRFFEHYSLPSAMLTQDFKFAYGAKHQVGKALEVVWSQILCRDALISVSSNQVEFREALGSHARARWIMATFFLHIKHTAASATGAEKVTLICFNAPKPLVESFDRLLQNPAWADVLQEPHLLFDIIYEELFVLFDNIVWKLAHLFRPLERGLLQRASPRTPEDSAIDFQELHVTVTNCIFLVENAEAVIATLDAMVARLKTKQARGATHLTDATIEALEYKRLNFYCILLRLQALEKRMSNVIGLSFNLVTQSDSKVMQADSRAMKAIAALTLVFLPATALASIFSTPFFQIDFEANSRKLQASASFWIFWAVTLPLTVVIVLLWLMWYKLSLRREQSPKPLVPFRTGSRPDTAFVKV